MLSFRPVVVLMLALLPMSAVAQDKWIDLNAAKPLQTQNLGEPVRSMRQGGIFLIPKPENKGWWYVSCYNPLRRNALPNQIFIVDLDSKKVTSRMEMPAGALVTNLNTQGLMGKDGKYYLPFLGTPLGLWSFDPRDASMKFHPTDIDLMLSPMTMGMASDGKIYVGSCSKIAALVEFDPATGKYRNLGEQGPHHEAPRYVWHMAVADDYIYVVAGKNPWYLLATDRKTGDQKILVKGDIDFMETRGSGENCTAWANFIDKGQKVTKHWRLKDGQAVEFDPAKEPRVPAAPAVPKPELLPTGALPNSEGKATLWFKLPGREWDQVNLSGIQTQPYKLDALCAMADGRLLGSARDYQDCFIFNPADNQFTILGKPPVSFGTMEALGDMVYLLGYPGSYMMQYDPKKPWTVGTSTPRHKEPEVTSPESNPRECYRWSVGVMPTHMIRASAIGADGFIYFGAHAERSAVGGGLGWWDPVARKPAGLRDPFVVQDCAGMAAARDGKLIIYSSFPVADPTGAIPKPAEAGLYLFDTVAKKYLGSIVPIRGITNCGPIAALGEKVFGIGSVGDNTFFYVVDLSRKETVFTTPIPSGYSPVIGPDKQLYLFVDKALVRVDPGTHAATVLGTVDPLGRITFLGKDIYLTGSPMLRRIPAIVK